MRSSLVKKYVDTLVEYKSEIFRKLSNIPYVFVILEKKNEVNLFQKFYYIVKIFKLQRICKSSSF